MKWVLGSWSLEKAWNDLKWRSNIEFWSLQVFIDVKEVIWSQKVDFGIQKVGLRTRERENVNANWVIWEDGVGGSGAK